MAQAAREEEWAARRRTTGEPIADSRPGLFGDLELDRPASFPLDHRGAVLHPASHAYIAHSQSHEVAAEQLAIDREIEEREIALARFELQPDADRPDLLWFERTFLTSEAALVPTKAWADELISMPLHQAFLLPYFKTVAQRRHYIQPMGGAIAASSSSRST